MTFFRRLFALSVAGLLFSGACHAAPKRYALVAHKPAALTQPPFAPLRSGPRAASWPSRQKQFPSSTPPGHGRGKTWMKLP